jgi:hypothetical protein
MVDLTTVTSGTITSQDVNHPGDASATVTVKFERADNQPTGTGVFKPFLTLQNSPIEQGYNTSGADVFDTKRVPQWNHDLTKGDLLALNGYYVFELDANETGVGSYKRLLSIDNIAIYTSSIGSQTTETTDANGMLTFSDGHLHYALNNPNTPQAVMPNWVKIDSTIGSTSGSGSSDMLVYIPVSVFAGVANSDYIYFYNLNGVHYNATKGTGAEAGFEEWRALTGPSVRVPDGGSTLMLLGSALGLLAWMRRRRA